MMKFLLSAAVLVGLSASAFAQTSDVSPGEAVGNASILPGNGGGSSVLPADPGSNSVLPQADGTRGSARTGIDTGTTRSVNPDVAIPNATAPNLNQPGTSIGEGVVPDSSGGIPNNLNGSGVPGSTSAGPSGGGSSAY